MAPINHPLFLKIIEEHNEITQLAERLKSDITLKEELLNLLELHHLKEDTFLFAPISAHPQISEGGPMCTYFFDEQINSPPMAKAQSLTHVAVEIPERLQKIWAGQSPIKIPIGEHIALQHILKYSDAQSLPKNIDQFIYLMKRNFQKEQECFFYVCAKLATKEALDEMLSRWLAFKA